MNEGDQGELYDMPIINGRKVMVFECGRPFDSEHGYGNLITGYSAKRNVYYEASDMTIKWFKFPFYVSRTPPTHEELAFQLNKWHNERQIKFILATFISFFILYLFFK